MTKMRTTTRAAGTLLTMLAWTGAHAAIGPDACDAKGFQTILHPAAAHFDARAVWLDARLVQWPGSPADGIFRLYHAARGTIAAPVGGRVAGADGDIELAASARPVPLAAAARFKYLAAGPVLRVDDADASRLPELHRGQLVLVREDAHGRVLDATRLQAAGALDDLYAAAGDLPLGLDVGAGRTGFTVWAPTARQAAVCVYDSGTNRARAVYQMEADARTGAWRATLPGDLTGKYYKYAVDVPVDAGIVRNLVTDPYSISLTTDSKRSFIARLDDARLKPSGWDTTPAPSTVAHPTDMVVYELHVRDFSRDDASVPPAHRGKYLAFTDTGSNGMRHLAALAKSGLTDIHLLPVYDIGSVPEVSCALPAPSGTPDGETQQALVKRTAHTDCFNWGYDPFHYNAP